jgi:hypothetical protein
VSPLLKPVYSVESLNEQTSSENSIADASAAAASGAVARAEGLGTSTTSYGPSGSTS